MNVKWDKLSPSQKRMISIDMKNAHNTACGHCAKYLWAIEVYPNPHQGQCPERLGPVIATAKDEKCWMSR